MTNQVDTSEQIIQVNKLQARIEKRWPAICDEFARAWATYCILRGVKADGTSRKDVWLKGERGALELAEELEETLGEDTFYI